MNLLSPRLNENELRNLSTLSIAQVGDAVFELMVRTSLCEGGGATAKMMHKNRVKSVNAAAQAALAKRLLPHITEAEQAVYNRGRNTQVGSVPHRASREEYQTATALETLWGWLWLTGQQERLMELWSKTLESQSKDG